MYCFFGVGGGCYWFFSSFRKMRERNAIRDIPTSKIHSLAMGLVEVQGAAKKAPPLTAPVSGNTCAHYRLEVSRLESSGKSSHWQTIYKDISNEIFELHDETGNVLVHPQDADFEFETKSFYFQGHTGSIPEDCKNKLAKQDLFATGWVGSLDSYKIEEWSIPLDHPLFVLGAATTPPESAGPDGPKALIKHDPNVNFFVISEVSQKELLKTLGCQVWFGLVGGALLTTGCLWVLLSYFARH